LKLFKLLQRKKVLRSLLQAVRRYWEHDGKASRALYCFVWRWCGV